MMHRKNYLYWPIFIGFVLLVAAFNIAGHDQETVVAETRLQPVATATSRSQLPSPVVEKFAATSTATIFEPSPVAPPQITPIPTIVLPTETAVSAPTATPIPEPTAPAWLSYLNLFRTMARLLPLSEKEELSYGALLHSRYMTYTDHLAHQENHDAKWYSPEGELAAKNGNIAASHSVSTADEWAIEYWVSGPFHLIPMIDPELRHVGYGATRSKVGQYQMTAVLNMEKPHTIEAVGPLSAASQNEQDTLATTPISPANPILFPAPNAKTWVIQQSDPEWPNPRHHCPDFPDYPLEVGPPIVAQVGTGSVTPQVTQHSFSADGIELPHCLFDETNFRSPNARQQATGRLILNQRDAIVLMPRSPLEPDKVYTVKLVVNGQPIEWQFTAVNEPAS